MLPILRTLGILATLTLLSACGKGEKPAVERDGTSFPETASALATPIVVENLQPSVDSLIHKFFDALIRKDMTTAASLVVQRKEYEAIYPLMPDADSNPQSPGFIAEMYVSGNKKHLDRWLDEAKSEGFVFSRYAVEGEEQGGSRYSLVRKVRLWIRDAEGEREFPAFRTLLKMPDGYKIWSILDT